VDVCLGVAKSLYQLLVRPFLYEEVGVPLMQILVKKNKVLHKRVVDDFNGFGEHPEVF
jgi:hypothetical protein